MQKSDFALSVSNDQKNMHSVHILLRIYIFLIWICIVGKLIALLSDDLVLKPEMPLLLFKVTKSSAYVMTCNAAAHSSGTIAIQIHVSTKIVDISPDFVPTCIRMAIVQQECSVVRRRLIDASLRYACDKVYFIEIITCLKGNIEE